jgi:hypothetical protein
MSAELKGTFPVRQLVVTETEELRTILRADGVRRIVRPVPGGR